MVAAARSTIARPAADRIARRRWRQDSGPRTQRLPEERRRELARVVVVGEDAGAARQLPRRPLLPTWSSAATCGSRGRSGRSGRAAAAPPPRRRRLGRVGSRRASGSGRPTAAAGRSRGQQVALPEPAARARRCSTAARAAQVRLVGASRMLRDAAAEAHARGASSSRTSPPCSAQANCGREAREAAADDRDLVHFGSSDPVSQGNVRAQTVRGNWPALLRSIVLHRTRASCRPGPVVRARSHRRRDAPRAARAVVAQPQVAHAAGSAPGDRLPSSRGAGGGAERIPRRRTRGLRTAQRRGLSDGLAGGADACRGDVRPRAASGSGRFAGAPLPPRLPAGRTGSTGVPPR